MDQRLVTLKKIVSEQEVFLVSDKEHDWSHLLEVYLQHDQTLRGLLVAPIPTAAAAPYNEVLTLLLANTQRIEKILQHHLSSLQNDLQTLHKGQRATSYYTQNA